MTNDGRKILYSERVRVPMWKYYDERGRLVYEEAEVADSPVNTPSCSGTSSSGTQSSGYNADKEAASGSSSGQSQNSQGNAHINIYKVYASQPVHIYVVINKQFLYPDNFIKMFGRIKILCTLIVFVYRLHTEDSS